MKSMGYRPFVEESEFAASTVSAFYIPEGMEWESFDKSLRQKGLAVGGSYGELAGKIFRLGHMGSQSDTTLIDQALEILQEVPH
jgi:aspartate aminotransferase-like enzyme